MYRAVVQNVVGCLEYDPETPVRQRHREFLQSSVLFKEVVPITDLGTRAKIHQTYRIGYLKVCPSKSHVGSVGDKSMQETTFYRSKYLAVWSQELTSNVNPSKYEHVVHNK